MEVLDLLQALFLAICLVSDKHQNLSLCSDRAAPFE
jgi:hypothetical protein